MSFLAGKVAIVTASTNGIGLAIARRLGLDGAKVVVSSRKQTNVDHTVQNLKGEGIEVVGTVCHVAKSADRDNLVKVAIEKYGKIDILVNNAGINPHFGSILDCPEDVWDKLFDVNVKSSFLLSKTVFKHMEKQKSGSIIFVSSITGYVPFVGITTYGVTKTALLGLTKAMSVNCASAGIRVNCIAPGIIKTDFSKALWDNPSEESEDMIKNMIPLGRLGEPDDCAGAVSFLASDRANYITGETILISGGINARL